MIYLGKATTMLYGAFCLTLSPFVAMYPFQTEFLYFFKYLSVRCTLSFGLISVGLLVPRWFTLITNDHVTKMYFSKKTKDVQLQTVSTFLRTINYQTNINNLQQIKDRKTAFGANNIICKETGRQFYIETTYLDDDILQYLGFIGYDNIDETQLVDQTEEESL